MFDKRSVGYGGAVFHGEILRGHARPENILAEWMNQRGCAFIGVKGNRHRHIGTVLQIRVVKRGPLRFTYVLRVLVVWPARELYVQERQVLASEHVTVLVDERGHLRFVLQSSSVIIGIAAPLVPQHARHMESLQRRDMVRINIAALYMPANRRATPRGLDDANWHIGVLGA